MISSETSPPDLRPQIAQFFFRYLLAEIFWWSTRPKDRKLTYPLNNSGWKTTFLLKLALFGGRVDFRGLYFLGLTISSLKFIFVFVHEIPMVFFWEKREDAVIKITLTWQNLSLSDLRHTTYQKRVDKWQVVVEALSILNGWNLKSWWHGCYNSSPASHSQPMVHVSPN